MAVTKETVTVATNTLDQRFEVNPEIITRAIADALDEEHGVRPVGTLKSIRYGFDIYDQTGSEQQVCLIYAADLDE